MGRAQALCAGTQEARACAGRGSFLAFLTHGQLGEIQDMTDDRWALFELVTRFDDAVNRRDADEFARLWTPDAVWEIDRPRPLHIEGRKAIVSTGTGMVAGTRWLFRGSFA